MAMGTSEAVLQILSGAGPRQLCSSLCYSNSDSIFPSGIQAKSVKRKPSRYINLFKCSSRQQTNIGGDSIKELGGFPRNTAVNKLHRLSCRCQKAESVSGFTAEDGNVAWFVDSAKKLNLKDVSNGSNVLEFDNVGHFEEEKKGLKSNGSGSTSRDKIHKLSIDTIEDEAWDLLRDSMVYYCGSPIGTIAANDPTSSNVLNYDQVFIRDFIPSGIAFLLKGEYDIVRNFILHTLQLQVTKLFDYGIHTNLKDKETMK